MIQSGPKCSSIPLKNRQFQLEKRNFEAISESFHSRANAFFWHQPLILVRKIKIGAKTSLKWEIWGVFLPAKKSLTLLITGF
jgi:hypothetical protein